MCIENPLYSLDQLKTINLDYHPEILSSIASNQWQDIHHSRKQDWMYWAIIGAIITGSIALVKSESNFSTNLFILNILFVLGAVISMWAAAISWSHWILHIKRLGYITWLSRFYFIKTGIEKIPVALPSYSKFKEKDIFVVNGLIFSIYLAISFAFVLLLLFFFIATVFEIKLEICNKYLASIPIIFLLIFIFLIYYIHKFTRNKMDNLRENYLKYLEQIK